MENNLITEVDILDEAKESFLVYAEEVLTDRAIPSAEDGLLSVQRKILWTMEEILKMSNSSKTKKSASLVGSTLASAYFHGDASCYGALCKMAQTYLMRYPLIEGQGSLGTQEANNMQASARYTEAKPSQYADLMMNDFKKNVVPLKETYNGEYFEPVVLPSLFPNAIVNGREAIGVSLAHNSLPANLTEVCNGIIEYIKRDGKITTQEIMEYIKGPDFPLGGTIINAKDIYTAYNTGHSTTSLKVRGDYEIKGDNIIFTSIPYRTYRNKIKEQINDNIDEFDKFLEDFNDESSVGVNRLVFKLKKNANAAAALNKIFALTDLQTTLSYNMNFIVDGTPKLCSLLELIQAYYVHQTNIILNAAKYDKDKAEARAHILRGLIIAIDKIDEVIALIKASKDKAEARNKLIAFLSIDEIQANAILDMKLSKLTRIDKEELINELKEQEELIAYCLKLIEEKLFRDNHLIEKIEKLRDTYGDERRTKLDNITEEKKTEYIEPEKCVVILTESGLVRRIAADTFKLQHRNGKGIKTKDDIVSKVIRTNTVDSLMIFTNLGKMYRLPVVNIPEGTKSSPLANIIEFKENETPEVIYSLYKDTEAKYLLFSTKDGLVKKTSLEEYNNTNKKTGIISINVRENDELVNTTLINEEELLLITEQGHIVRTKAESFPAQSRTSQGVKGVNLNPGDSLKTVIPIRDLNDDLALFMKNGTGKRIKLSEIPIANRGTKGSVYVKGDEIAAASMVADEDQILIIGDKSSICIKCSEIPTFNTKTSLGNYIIKNSNIVSVSKV